MLLWNDADRVLQLLERLRTIDPAPDDVIVVDNGSAGDSAASISSRFPHHTLVSLPHNLGFAAAVNRGIRVALERGNSWVWLLNSDVALPAGVLGSLRAAACSGERTAMAAPVLTWPDGTVQAFGGGNLNAWTGMLRHSASAEDLPAYLSAACLLIRARVLDEIGMFDEGYFFYWEDVEFSFRARAAGWQLAVAADCRVVHREGSSLGRWSEERWAFLFRGMTRFLRGHARLPRTAGLLRLFHHTITMLGRGRLAPVRGAWRAVAGDLRLPRAPVRRMRG